MKLYLLRHGHSPSVTDAKVKDDFHRPLSDLGRQGVARMASELARRGGTPSLILHSPLLRAVETAGLAAAALKPAQGAEVFGPLKNELPPDELLAALNQRCAGVAEVLAVGHQPQLGELAAHLCGRVSELRPGGMIALELSPARLLWACNPEELAR